MPTTQPTGHRFCPRCGLATDAAHCPQDGTTTLERTAIGAGPTQFQPGDVIGGRYRLKRMLGRGGFGAVFCAEHTATGQEIALKVLAVEASTATEQTVRRFHAEARLTSRLRHPNTVKVHDFGQADNGALYMAMELLSGPSLEDTLRSVHGRGEGMAEFDALDMAIAVLRSLAEAHDAGLVHRDLKPANILWNDVPGEAPVLKVVDFGVARAQDSGLTGTGTVVGTPAYMSPEQCRAQPVDGRSDLYALGVILWRCVTGAVPFHDPNPMTVMFQHVQGTLPDLRAEALTPISDGFIACVQQALAKDREQRFPAAKAMRLALEGLRGGAWAGTPQAMDATLATPAWTPVAARRPSGSQPAVIAGESVDGVTAATLQGVRMADPKPARRRIGLVAAAVGVLVGLGAVGIWLAVRDSTPPPPVVAVAPPVPVTAPAVSPPVASVPPTVPAQHAETAPASVPVQPAAPQAATPEPIPTGEPAPAKPKPAAKKPGAKKKGRPEDAFLIQVP
jgi:serine/threonine-protein kinase